MKIIFLRLNGPATNWADKGGAKDNPECPWFLQLDILFEHGGQRFQKYVNFSCTEQGDVDPKLFQSAMRALAARIP